MLGMVVAIGTLLAYIQNHLGDVRFHAMPTTEAAIRHDSV
jgi:hypothetical protein